MYFNFERGICPGPRAFIRAIFLVFSKHDFRKNVCLSNKDIIWYDVIHVAKE